MSTRSLVGDEIEQRPLNRRLRFWLFWSSIRVTDCLIMCYRICKLSYLIHYSSEMAHLRSESDSMIHVFHLCAKSVLNIDEYSLAKLTSFWNLLLEISQSLSCFNYFFFSISIEYNYLVKRMDFTNKICKTKLFA